MIVRAHKGDKAMTTYDQRWAIMTQNLRRTPCDPRCPEMWQVPITPDGGGNVLAVVYGNTTSGEASKKECMEKARLIAAAPDLLLACLEAYEQMPDNNANQSAAIDMLRDAIAKATGRTE